MMLNIFDRPKLSGLEETFMAASARPQNAQEIYLQKRKDELKKKTLLRRIIEALGPDEEFTKRERLM